MCGFAGGEPIDLGIAGDTLAALEAGIAKAREGKADVLVTLGGASVGDHDLVKSALAKEGMELGFWRIAMRPGKPLIHGRIGTTPILGLPGNPVSAIVCTVVFLIPLIEALLGGNPSADEMGEAAVLGAAMRANDWRQDFVRATLSSRADGVSVATPLNLQDSSLLRVMAASQRPHHPHAECTRGESGRCLPHPPPAQAGDLERSQGARPLLLQVRRRRMIRQSLESNKSNKEDAMHGNSDVGHGRSSPASLSESSPLWALPISCRSFPGQGGAGGMDADLHRLCRRNGRRHRRAAL